MATRSFYEMLEIDTPEKARRLAKAFELSKDREPAVFSNDILKELEMGEEHIRGNVAWMPHCPSRLHG
jgi:hypothetical protein